MNNEISQNNYVSFRAITDYIFSKKKILIVITLLGVIIGIAYAWFQKPKYIAKITYVVEADNGSKMGGYASIAAQFGIDLGQSSNSAFEGDNLNEILKSRTLIEKTLFSYCNNINKNSELLVHKYVQTNNVRMPNGIAFTKDSKGITNRIKDSLINLFIKDLQKRIVVERKDKKLNIITLSIETNEESFSKEFIEKLTENAIQYYTEYKSSRNNFNLKILQNQADSLRVVLFSNIGDAASISDLNVNPLKQSGRISVQKKQIDIQVASVMYTEILKNLEIAKLTARKETPLIQIIDKPVYPLEKIKYGRLFTGIVFGILFSFIAIVFYVLKKII